MQVRRGIAAKTAIAVLVMTVAGGIAFLLTHSLWYDCLDLEHKVSFWVEAAVAYGTIALAFVTWGSVRESQDIVTAEDLRFRQSRMPMVAVYATYREHGGVFFLLRNRGDGPAINVRVTFEARMILRWNKDGLADDRNESEETSVSAANERCSSFMSVGDDGECKWLFGAKDREPYAMNAVSSITFSRLTIEYEDTFGGKYVTEHDPNVGGEIVPLRFTWTPPPVLVAKPAPDPRP